MAVTVGLLAAGCGGASAPSAASGPASGPLSGSASVPASAVSGSQGSAPAGPTGPKAPPVAAGTPSVAVRWAATVRIGSSAAIVPGVVVAVGPVRTLMVRPKVPGEIAGQGVAVPITIRNASGRTFPLSGLVVNASYRGGTPADPSPSTSTPMAGSLLPRHSARGTYVFRLPTPDAGTLRLEVVSDQSATILQFAR